MSPEEAGRLRAELEAAAAENERLQAEAERREHQVSNLMWRIKDVQRQLYQQGGKKKRGGGGCYGYCG